MQELGEIKILFGGKLFKIENSLVLILLLGALGHTRWRQGWAEERVGRG
jgi:hypothetical protein